MASWLMNETYPKWLSLEPPPDSILSMPPPPMPIFLANTLLPSGNHTTAVPCPILCDWLTGQGMEVNEELPQKGGNESEHSWFLFTASSFTGILLLIVLFVVLIMKYRQEHRFRYTLRKTYKDRTYESILYPSLNDNHLLWTTLTPKGKTQTVAVTSTPPPLPPRLAHSKSFDNGAFANGEDYATYARPLASSPISIENPNVPPINYYRPYKGNYPSLL